MILNMSRIILATLPSLLFVASASADDVDLDIALADGSVAKVHISDDAGPLNSWKDVTPGIFDPATGTFTNSSSIGNARGCGVDACWIANGFDIDKVKVGDQGKGKVNFATEDNQIGDMSWTVTKVD
ncbi:hypothetical protein L2449_09340 [Mesorhizobium muleiense]|uniref:hypothetical protein n=1 Tax=Mesorhizobium muleiense TaxID=1004279 RepID=UPI001F1C0501|nr:hypothetical protein [Mesorhizobium muleiense]MCF6117116.1 hypothetical protein [Mesorhizobium muleiense]